MSVHREWLLIRPRTEWTVGATTYRPGSLLAVRYDEFLSGARELTVVFEPDEHSSLENYAWTRDHLVLVTLVDVSSHVDLVTPGTWERSSDPRHPAEHQHRAGGHRRVRRRDVPGLKRFRHTVAAAVGARGYRGDHDQERARVLRCVRHRGHPALRGVGRRHRDPVLRRGPSRFDRSGTDAARRVRRVRGCQHAGLRRCARPAVAGPRRHLRAGQHPRRRRVRTDVAHPGDAREPTSGVRRLRRGGIRSRRPRHHHRRRSSAPRAAATAAC